jgi:hypothetical protein
MMKKPAVLFLAFLFALTLPDASLARGGNGGRHSSSSSHSSGRHVPAGTYVERKCKTAACFRKHPSGHYGFVSGERKRKD